jgi:putative aldouronate transport system permease protein
MRTFFQTTVPDAVVESAKIDGARQIRIFAQIVLPISLPALATIGLFFAFAFWNDWFLAKMYLDTNRKDLYPLQYLLMSIETNIDFLQSNKEFMTAGTQTMIPSETIRMAIVMVLVVPIACTYPFFQRYFISGLTIGAVKG